MDKIMVSVLEVSVHMTNSASIPQLTISTVKSIACTKCLLVAINSIEHNNMYMYILRTNVTKHTVTTTLKSVVCHGQPFSAVPLPSAQPQLDKSLLLQFTTSYWTMMDGQMNGYIALLVGSMAAVA